MLCRCSGAGFVAAKDSPTRRPLVTISNEITGTVSFYSIAPRRN